MRFLSTILILLSIFSSNAFAGKSYSSGGSKPSFSGKSFSSPKPSSAPSFSGKSYGSGGGSKPTVKPSSSGKSYGSGNITPPATGPPKSNSNIDKDGVKIRQKQESQRRYEQSQAPAKTYKDPKTGQSKPIETNSVTKIRNTITVDKYVYRGHRINDFYSPYIGRPVVYYSDPFGPFFWLWLMDRSADERAMWAYHHRSEMDSARYAELLKKDAELEAKIKAFEQKGMKQDVGYVPSALQENPDLMYNDSYVEAAYNPKPSSNIWLWIFLIVIILFILFFIAWIVFFREIPGT